MTKHELEALPTKALLARRTGLLRCEESFSLSDESGAETGVSDIRFKDTPQWKRAYEELLSVLTEREHIVTGIGLEQLRKKKIEARKTRDKRAGRSDRTGPAFHR
jgi:hypothetical protein